jgi:hypothetical protein
MLGRCYRSSHRRFGDWGGRGIRVCGEWRDFATFRSWAEANGYQPDREIDRIDNDGDYRPDNCRWASEPEQASNRRSCIPVTAFGETRPIHKWIGDPRCKVSIAALKSRVKAGWDHEDAMSIPSVSGWRGRKLMEEYASKK